MRKTLSLLAALAVFFSLIAPAAGNVTAQEATTTLLVGTAKFDMTPEVDRYLGGYATDRITHIATDVLDPVYFRVLVLQKENDPAHRLLFLAPDICIFEDHDADSPFAPGTLQRFAAAADVSVEQVFLAPTHTHQGPASFNHDPDTETALYNDDQRMLDGFVNAIKEAVDNMKPVNMGVVLDRNDLAVNRRPYYEVSPMLPYDNRVLGLKFTDPVDNSPVAYLVNYSCHQTALGNDQYLNTNLITTEIIGWGINTIEEAYTDDYPNFVAIFINGFYGAAGPNINGSKNADYTTMKARGIAFGNEVLASFAPVTPVPFTSTLNCAFEETNVTVVVPGIAPFLFPIQFRAAQIGDDLGFVGVTVEAFAELGAYIRAYSPFENTLIAANLSGFSSYAPTYDAKHDGVGGPEVTDRTVFEDSIGDTVISHSIALLRSLKSETLNEYSITAASASESNPYHPAAYAFDGNTRSKWFGRGSSNVWLQADLGANKPVSKVVMDFGDFSRLEAGKDFRILISDDPTFAAYTVAATETGNSTGIMAYRFAPVAGRYVRFECTAAYGDDSRFFPAVYEMQVYGTGTAGTGKFTPPDATIHSDALFSDTFSSGSAPSATNWTNTAQSAVVSGDKLVLTDNGTGMLRTKQTDWINYRFEADVMLHTDHYFGLVFRATDNNNAYMWQFSMGSLNFMRRVNGTWTEIKPYIALPIRLQGDPLADIMRRIAVEVSGSTIRTYIDDILIDTTVDPTYTQGGVGFWTNGKVSIDNASVRPVQPLLKDNFTDLSMWELDNQSGTAGVSGNTLTLNANDGVSSRYSNDWSDYTFEFDADMAANAYRGVSFRMQENGDDYLWWFGDSGWQIIRRIAAEGGWTPIGNSVTPYALSGVHHFKASVSGNILTTYIDGNLCNSAIDDALTHGGVGLLVGYGTAAYQNVLVENINMQLPTFSEGILYADNFSGNLGLLWDYGVASVTNNTLTLGTNGYITSKYGSGWTNYTFEFDSDMAANAYRGVSFRVQENGDDYLWWLGDSGWQIVKRVTTEGGWTPIGSVFVPDAPLTGMHHFKVSVKGNVLTTYVDGNLCNSVVDGTLTHGDVGLLVAYLSASYQNIVVTRIDPRPLEFEEGYLYADAFDTDLDFWNANGASIENGMLKLDVSKASGGDAFVKSLLGDTWSNYEIEFDADYSGIPYRGVSFRTQGNGDDYFWWFGNEANGGAQFIKRVAAEGGWEPIGDSNENVRLSGTHHFKLVIDGDTFTAYVDGALYNTATDRALTNGGIALHLTMGEAYYSHLTVCANKNDTASGLINALKEQVISENMPEGPQFLDNALRMLSKGQYDQAKKQMEQFLHKVQVTNDNKLSKEKADYLVNKAMVIISLIEDAGT